jgi:hypothetical protein
VLALASYCCIVPLAFSDPNYLQLKTTINNASGADDNDDDDDDVDDDNKTYLSTIE